MKIKLDCIEESHLYRLSALLSTGKNYIMFSQSVDFLANKILELVEHEKKEEDMKITRTTKAFKYQHHETGDVEYLAPDAPQSEVVRLMAVGFSFEGEVEIKLTATNNEFMKIATIREV